MIRRRLPLGVIGFGKLGSLHARSIADSSRAKLVAVCDADEAACERAESYGVPATTDLEEFLALPIEGVVIASNTPMHTPHIQAAARAGKAIFTEKPVGLTLEATDLVLQDVVDAGVPFQIGFQRRWDARYRQARDVIESGEIGDPVLFKAHGRDPNASDPANWGLDRNGGLFLNCAIHDFDAARFLMGRQVEGVAASGRALVHRGLADHGDIDTCSVSLFLGGDAMALTEWSRYASYGYDVAMEVVGTRGMVQFGAGRGGELSVHLSNSHGPSVFDVFGDAFRASMEGFVDAILSGEATQPGVEDARTALQVALAARRSYESGGALVPIPSLRPLRPLGTEQPSHLTPVARA
jgi:predicted dehydrogenase